MGDNQYPKPTQRKTVNRLLVGQVATGQANGTTFTQTFRVPEGYTKVTGVYFDPAQDVRLTVNSQNLNSEIVNNVSTKIGSAMGFINPAHEWAVQDILTVTGICTSITGTTIAVTIQYE